MLTLLTLSLLAVVNFRVAPPYFQLRLHPGETIDTSLLVIPENERTPLLLSVWPMVLDSLHGGPEPGPTTYPFSAHRWITLPTQRMLIQEATSIPFQIHVPETTEPGGYFAIITLKPEISSEGSSSRRAGARIIPEYGATLWISVGEGSSTLEVGQLEAFHKEDQILFRIPLWVSGRFHRSFTGYLEIQDSTGHKVFETLVNKSWVLPKLRRVLTVSWTPPIPGKYKAFLVIQDSTGIVSYQEMGVRVRGAP